MTVERNTPHVGEKFNADGSVRTFPGNTVICFAHPEEPLYQMAEWVQQHLLKQPFAHKYALLPPDSFHMTIMPMLCDQVRKPEQWSAHLPLDCTLEHADQFIAERVNSIVPPENFRMAFDRVAARGGLSIDLIPADQQTAIALWTYRNALSEATGIHFPDHNSYGFHLSLAYKITELTPGEHWHLLQYLDECNTYVQPRVSDFNTRRPYVTYFDDMFRFVTDEEKQQLHTRNE
ncbi:MAG: DUF1868 domain-containing protein [Chloroflexota bacterium]